jgi:hypothetical protein
MNTYKPNPQILQFFAMEESSITLFNLVKLSDIGKD